MAERGPPGTLALVLALALLSALAGCSVDTAPTGDARTERPVTPAPVPTDRPIDAALPSGVSPTGVVDAERLEVAHARALTNASFVERARTTVRLENGSVAIEGSYVDRHGRNATVVWLRRNGTLEYGVPDRSLVEAGVWGNASFGVRRVVTAHGRVELGAFEGAGLFYRRPRGGYGLALREAETAVEPRRTANGSFGYVLAAEGVDFRGPWYFRGSFMRTREDGRARVVVAPDGTIRRFAVGFPIRLDGRNATLRHTYTVEPGAVTVTRPAWFDGAVEGRDAVPFAVGGRGSQPSAVSPASSR